MNERKKNGFLRIPVTLLVFAMMIIGCKEESTGTGFLSKFRDGSGNTRLFEFVQDQLSKSKTRGGSVNRYTLTTNKIVKDKYLELQGTNYVLSIKMKDGSRKTSRGIIKESGIVDGNIILQLQPSIENSSAFKVTLTFDDKWNISSIDGVIAVEGGDTVNSPGSISVIITDTAYR